MEYCSVYVTCSGADEARKLAREIVELRLAACANVAESIESVYWWKGKLEKDKEAVVIFKTRRELFERLASEIKKRHSYEVPCIVAWPIIEGNADYLDWVAAETKQP